MTSYGANTGPNSSGTPTFITGQGFVTRSLHTEPEPEGGVSDSVQ